MPIVTGAIIGVQLASGYFTYSQNKKQGKKIRALQEDYERTVQEEGMERAWQKLYDLQNCQRELEIEMQNDRIAKIDYDFAKEIENLAHRSALENLPLSVPPFVMKGETLNMGNQLDSAVAVPLHCIFTRSNDKDFNSAMYRMLENRLSQYFTQYWGNASSHPVLFYSGAYTEEKNIGVKADNLNTPDAIGNLPTLIVSPMLPKHGDDFYFEVSIWGIPNLEIKAGKFIPNVIKFPYKQKQKEYTKENKTQIVNELCPPLEAFISYIADQYYWAYDKVPPLLPSLLANGIIPTQENNLLKEYQQNYLDMFDKYVVEDNEENRLNMLSTPENSLELCEGIKELVTKDNYDGFLDFSLKKLCQVRCKYRFEKENTEELLSFDILRMSDIPYLRKLQKIYEQDENNYLVSRIKSKIENITTQYYTTLPPYKIILKRKGLTLLDVLTWASQYKNDFAKGTKFHITIKQDLFCILTAFVKNEEIEYTPNCGIGIFLSKQFYIPKSIKIQQNKIITDINKIDEIIKILNSHIMKEKEAYDKVLQEIGELSNHVNVFSEHLKEIGKNIRKEVEAEGGINKNMEFFFDTLKYETVFDWIRKNYVTGADGVILSKEKNLSFRKEGMYKISMCYVKDKEALVSENHSRIAYFFNNLDDSLDDLFGNKNNIILKNK